MEKEEVGRQDYKNFDIKEWLSRKIFYIFMLFVVINRNDKNNPPRITHFCPARIFPYANLRNKYISKQITKKGYMPMLLWWRWSRCPLTLASEYLIVVLLGVPHYSSNWQNTLFITTVYGLHTKKPSHQVL